MDEIFKCDHSNDSYGTILSCGAVYCPVQGGSKSCNCVWGLSISIKSIHSTVEEYFA